MNKYKIGDKFKGEDGQVVEIIAIENNLLDPRIDIKVTNAQGVCIMTDWGYESDMDRVLTEYNLSEIYVESSNQELLLQSYERECTCSGHTLLHYGCRCGYVKK
jgi:hypothetical protein